jgi:hypothetical protein
MEWAVSGVFLLCFLVFVVGGLVVLIYALVDAIRMPNDADFKAGTQLVWILVILLAQVIGAIICLIVGRPPGGATAGARAPAPARVDPTTTDRSRRLTRC